MSLKPRFHDLWTELRQRHEALWESLLLLEPEEWPTPRPGWHAPAVLAESIRRDRDLLAVVEAAAVGLPEVTTAAAVAPVGEPEALLSQAVAVADELEARLGALDNHQWQRRVRLGRETRSLAEWVAATNDALQQAQGQVDAYLGSFERLGREGLQNWLLFVYNDLMDSIAGMSEAELMGPAWHGEWNTFRLLEHVWAWNEQLLETALHWHEDAAPPPLRDLPCYGEYNPHVGKVYEGTDMVTLADGLVTVYRKTAAFVARCDPALLTLARPSPWPGRLPLSNLIFEVYRHAWHHARAIREHVGKVGNQ
ncbi:MAG: DinB family protein [Anaerolineae bacterium]|nr:DinB family protein [Caldilineales bacterium]MDW8268360.1 DinB family protein [Anaerolineae bacterium]